MKCFAIFLLVCFCTSFNASAQFTWSNPQPSGWYNKKVVFTNSDTGYIINSNGDLIQSANSGLEWKIIKSFYRCSSMDARESFIIIGGADTSMYISTDKAKSWKKGVIRQSQIVEKIQIISKDTIFALSKYSNLGNTELYQSKDGGLTWQLMNKDFIIKGINFINSKLGYATSFGGIYKTIDGGITWQSIYNKIGGYPFITIKFLNSQLGFAAQDLGVVIKTTDGGVNWSVCLDHTLDNIDDICFGDSATIYLAGQDGAIYQSIDTGNTWQFKPNHFGDRYGIYSMHFTDATTGYFVGLRGRIFKTVDGGDSYTDYSPSYLDVKPLSFPTPSTGYAGVWSDLMKTTDSGKSWAKLPVSAGDPLYSRFENIHFFSNDTGLALAETPVKIFKTFDGGQSWTPVSIPPISKEYIKGFFVLNNTVYLNIKGAVGTYMLMSRDRGETWQTRAIDYTGNSDFKALFFTDEKIGYGLLGGSLKKTTDSAKTWTAINLFNSNWSMLNNLWFTSPSNGYIAGDQGFNLATRDSGKTWTQFAVEPGNFNFSNVYAIRFFNQNVGYLTSGSGGIYRTIDAGKTWTPEKKAPGDCKTIQMTSDTMLFIGGEYGIILKKDMREYNIDSFNVGFPTPCTAKISAKVSAVLSTIDSIWLEYGTTDFSRSTVPTPASVKDSSVKVETLLTGYSADSIYQARVKIRYRGADLYSNTIVFRPPNGLPKPSITYNGTTLTSSATSGNQWYLNGVAIAGANGVTYTPTTQGIYTVQQQVDNCVSAKSEGYNYIATALLDPILAQSIQIFPNPVTTEIWIRNEGSKKLQLTIIDLWGRVLKSIQTSKSVDQMNLINLNSGIYNLIIEELSSHRKTTAKLIKL